MSTRSWFFALACTFLLGAAPSRAWDWKLTPDEFKKLNVFERQSWQQAEKLVGEKKYKEASLAFEKFTLEFTASQAIGKAMFMKAFCLEQDLKRNNAMKAYWEIIDYFPNDVDLAGLCFFRIGVCHWDNGDFAPAMKQFKKMVEHEKYRYHELAAEALRRLGENDRQNNDWPKALTWWRQIYADFYDRNRQLADWARDEIVRYYLKEGRFPKIEDLVTQHNWKEPRGSIEYWDYVYSLGVGQVLPQWYSVVEQGSRRPDDAKRLYEYWATAKPLYLKANRKWDFLNRSLQFYLAYRPADRTTWEPFATEAVGLGDDNIVKEIMTILINAGQYDMAMPMLKLVKNLQDGKHDGMIQGIMAALMGKGQYDRALPLEGLIVNKQAIYPWFFSELLGAKRLDHAAYINNKIEDALLQRWNNYLIANAQQDWKKCLEILKDVANSDAGRTPAANRAMVGIYRDKLRQFDDAMKILFIINQPPVTLFEVASCMQAKGDYPAADTQYREIENFFPPSAAEAAWQRARMWHNIGAIDKAVAEYRRILKVYPRQIQSAQSHDQLELLGKLTGGGVDEK